MQNKILHKKVAVITGASRGIGRDIALSYAREGAFLVLICLDDEDCLMEVQQEAEQLGAKLASHLGDVSKLDPCHFGAVVVTAHSSGCVDCNVMSGLIKLVDLGNSGLPRFGHLIIAVCQSAEGSIQVKYVTH